MTYLGATLLALMGASMLVVSSIPEAVADFASADPEVRKIPIDTVKTVLRTMGIYSLVVGVALCGLATYAQRGRNWARIALTITGLLQVIIPGVVDLGSPQTVSASGVLYVLYVLYVAIAVILFWNRSAQSWYRTQKVVE
jgi:cytochrome b561